MSYEDISWWVSNPLVLLIVGAGLSGVLIPSITRKWQDHQKELDLKVELVDRLSESVTSILIAARDATSRDDAMEEDIRNYHKGCSYITSRIEAFFYGSNYQILDEWDKYDYVIQRFYELPGTNEDAPEKKLQREALIKIIQDYVEEYQKGQDPKEKEVDWETLKKPRTQETKNVINQEMNNLIERLFKIKHDLMRDIMNSKIPAFNKGLSFKKVRQEFNRLFSR